MTGQTMETDRIHQVIRSWEKAVQTGDIERLLAHHTDDVLMFDVPEPLQAKGLDEYRKTWELFYTYGSPDSDLFVVEELQITAGSEVAFATGLLRIGGSKEPVCRLTLGLKKVRGTWRIAHEHHSAPHKLGHGFVDE